MKILVNFLSIVLFFNVAVCQNVIRAKQNIKQFSGGNKNLESDSKELEAFKLKIAAFDKAFEARNLVVSNELKLSLLEDMAREVQQSNVKEKQARLEKVQRSAEIRAGNRKAIGCKNNANQRDELLERKDDIKDSKQQIKRAKHQSIIVETLKFYEFSFELINLELAVANKEMLHHFLELLEEDLLAAKKELTIDRSARPVDLD